MAPVGRLLSSLPLPAVVLPEVGGQARYCGCYGSTATGCTTVSLPTPCWTRQELWRGGTVQSPRAASPQAPDWLRHSTASNAGSYCVLCFVLSREYHSPRRPSTRFMRHRAAVQTPRRALCFRRQHGLRGSTTSCAGGAWHSLVPAHLCLLIVPALGTVLTREYHSLRQVPMQCSVCRALGTVLSRGTTRCASPYAMFCVCCGALCQVVLSALCSLLSALLCQVVGSARWGGFGALYFLPITRARA